MARRTKKAGIVATFGARYGTSVRKKYKKAAESSRKKYQCPKCTYSSVKRISSGIWQCRHCKYKFAGGAYQPLSDAMKNRLLIFKKVNEQMDR